MNRKNLCQRRWQKTNKIWYHLSSVTVLTVMLHFWKFWSRSKDSSDRGGTKQSFKCFSQSFWKKKKMEKKKKQSANWKLRKPECHVGWTAAGCTSRGNFWAEKRKKQKQISLFLQKTVSSKNCSFLNVVPSGKFDAWRSEVCDAYISTDSAPLPPTYFRSHANSVLQRWNEF